MIIDSISLNPHTPNGKEQEHEFNKIKSVRMLYFSFLSKDEGQSRSKT